MIHDPPNEHKLDHIWAFISSDEKGEGLISVPTPMGNMPLIAGDERRLKDIRQLAMALKNAGVTKKGIKLIKFTGREDLETL